ncbi:MAG: DNA polymerase III subunit gamma and tau [Arcanobacterium sp.]|nr:DNA polymerase III subunit gamma and tau [Arcanobacterium sp.]
MSIALYRRYRPQIFEEVIGQEHVTDPLMAALDAGRTTHAYLFSGPRGCGKTTSARILARCLNCVEYPTATPCGECDSCKELARGGSGSFDVVELDAASHGSVDDARELREQAGFAPVRDRFKIFIIDEAHMVTSHGFNALLKLVEEPPPHVKFIFATTEPEKVIGTIRSRTHHYPFRLVPPPVLESYLTEICADEGVEASPEILSLVVRAGTGSVRDTLSVLDQIIGGSDGVHLEYERAVALLGYTSAHLLDASVEAIAKADGARLFGVVDDLVRSGHDPRRFAEDLLQRLRDLVILSLAGSSVRNVFVSVPDDQFALMEAQAEMLGARRASRSADLVNEALSQMLGATAPRLQLELLCARLVVAQESFANTGVSAPSNISQNIPGAQSVASGGEKPQVPATPGGDVSANVQKQRPAETSAHQEEVNSQRRVKPNERPMPQIPVDIAGLSGIGVVAGVSEATSAEANTTERENVPVVKADKAIDRTARLESAEGTEGAESTGGASAAATPFSAITASWVEIKENAANRAPAAINLFQRMAQPKSVENNVVSIPLGNQDDIEKFNRNFAVLDAIAFAIYDVTRLKTRIQGVFDPNLAEQNLDEQNLAEPNVARVGDADLKEFTDSSVMVNQESEIEIESVTAQTESETGLVGDPAGILGAVVDGEAIFVVSESSMKNSLADSLADDSAISSPEPGFVPGSETDFAAGNVKSVENVASESLSAASAGTVQSGAQVPFFAQDLPSIPPIQDPFSEPKPESSFATLVTQKDFTENGNSTSADVAEGYEPEPTNIDYGDDWDAVTDEDPELDISKLYGVEVAIKAFDARVVKEQPTQEEGN